MIESLTQKQKTEMTRFMWSMLAMPIDPMIITGTTSVNGKCYIGEIGKTKIFECMAIAFSQDGLNAYGITFDGEFIFFNNKNFIKGFPIVMTRE